MGETTVYTMRAQELELPGPADYSRRLPFPIRREEPPTLPLIISPSPLDKTHENDLRAIRGDVWRHGERKWQIWPGLTNAPLDVLPNEIWARVFELAAETRDDDDPDTIRQDTCVSLLLSHVSPRWRNIAVTNPRLWTYICVQYPYKPIREWMWIRICMDRSKACLLDVALDVRDIRTSFSMEPVKILLSHISRWRTFRLRCGPSPTSCNLAFSSLQGMIAPSLTRLMIYPTWSVDENPLHIPILCSRFAPNLASLCIKNSNIDWAPLDFPFLRKLEVLGHNSSLLSPSSRRFGMFLGPCMQLDTLVMTGGYPRLASDYRVHRSTISLPSLRNLFCYDCTPEDVFAFLTIVSFPNIRSLQFQSHFDLPVQCLAPIAVAPPPFPHLRDLRLLSGTQPLPIQYSFHDGLTTFLSDSWSSVRSVRISGSHWAPFLLNALMHKWCPSVRTLFCANVTVHSLCYVVAERERRGRKIEEIRIGRDMEARMSGEEMEWLMARVRLGNPDSYY